MMVDGCTRTAATWSTEVAMMLRRLGTSSVMVLDMGTWAVAEVTSGTA